MSKYRSFIESHFEIKSESHNARRGGTEALILCPIHGDSNPSMYFNLDSGMWICHACGAKGTAEMLAKHMDTTITDTLIPADTLRERLHRPQNRSGAPESLPDGYLDDFDFETPYWRNRGLSRDAEKLFRLGYDPERNDGTIPLRSSKGVLQGIIRRTLDENHDGPRYMYPKGFAIGKHLFASWLIKTTKFSRVALVEGSLDAVACWDAGRPALGLLGARITEDQVKLLRSLGITSVVCMTDNDRAGRDAIPQIHDALTGISFSVGRYERKWAKDPGDLTPGQRRKLFDSSVPWHRWLTE